MDAIHLTRQKEYGFSVPKDYSLAFKHLKCYSKDNFGYADEEEYLARSPSIACRFCRVPNYENYLALANEDGLLTIQDTNQKSSTKNSAVIKRIQGHRNVIFDLAWCPGSLKLVSVSGDNTCILWDVGAEGGRIIPIHRFHGHCQSVKTVSFSLEEKNVFATGSRDGKIMIWDTRLSQPTPLAVEPDNTISFCHFSASSSKLPNCKRLQPQRADSVTSVIFKDSYSVISCSAGDRLIKVWDIRKYYSAYKRIPQPSHVMIQPENCAKSGFSNLMMDDVSGRLYANGMDDTIYCYNVATYLEQPVAMFRGHKNRTFYVRSCLSNDGRFLVSGSSDNKAYIWDIKNPEKCVAEMVGHDAEVTCVDWCHKGEMKLVTCSDDSSYRIWRLIPDADVERQSDLQGWVELSSVNDIKHTDSSVALFHATPRALKRAVNTQEHTPDVTLETTESGSKTTKDDDQRPILSPYSDNTLLRSESRGARRLFDDGSNSGIETLSPTSNLPNYIMDGTSPHHRCMVNRQKENQNWLTKLQVTPPPKNARITPKRKPNQTTPKTPKLQCGSLLNFFKGNVKQSLTKSCEIQREHLFAEPIVMESTTP